MDEKELIAEFIREEENATELHIMVCHIMWLGPYTPSSSWTCARTLPNSATREERDESIQSILHDSEFFQMCVECQERQPVGWMFSRTICMGCAERNHGVVY